MSTREPLLLTPGPLTTSLATKMAMLRDWGSWDQDFNALTAAICARLVRLIDDQSQSYACVPLQGSGTFAVEAAIGTLVPREGKLLVLVNGAYGKRMARLTRIMGRACSVLDFGEIDAVDPRRVDQALAEDAAITHVGIVHCETSTGILNPLEAVAAAVAGRGRGLIVDAMSSLGALPLSVRTTPCEAVIASSNKCLEGVPGMGFVLARQEALAGAADCAHSLSMDLYDQWHYLKQTGQWRFTPPTHVVAAFAAALQQYDAAGGQPARLQRYRANCQALVQGLQALGLRPLLAPAVQAPIIVTVHAPQHPNWNFSRLYERVKARGVILYPGKLTTIETFRVGCIGAIEPPDLEAAVHAIGAGLAELQIPTGTPLAASNPTPS